MDQRCRYWGFVAILRFSNEGSRMTSPDSQVSQSADLSAMEEAQPDVLDQLMSFGSAPSTMGQSDRSRSDRRAGTVGISH